MSVRLAIPVTLLSMCSSAVFAADVFVDVDAAGVSDGSSWTDAYRNLRPALNNAEAGDVVRIAQGTYRPAAVGGSRLHTFEIPDGVRVIGGYAGGGEVDPDAFDPEVYITILSGDLNGNDGPDFANNDENSYHVVTVRNTNPGTLLRGVIVSGGNSDQTPTGSDTPEGMGGGIMCFNSTLVLRDCIIEANRADKHGGGLVVNLINPRPIHMRNCIVRGNEVTSLTGSAAGVRAASQSTFADCVFEDNSCTGGSQGGGLRVSNATIERCEFTTNVAGDAGGAIMGEGGLEISDCTFIGNDVGGGWGGALYLQGENLVRNCLFEGNDGTNGGAIRFHETFDPTAELTVIECDFIDNEADDTGGAIHSRGDLRVVNCNFLGNAVPSIFGSGSANFGSGGAIRSDDRLVAVNCLFSGNSSATFGSAISAGGPTSLVNCTIVSNEGNTMPPPFITIPGGAVSAGGILNLHNCILWDNVSTAATVEAQQVFHHDPTVYRIRNSIIQGWTGNLGGSQNNGNDPLLIDPDGADDTIGTTDDNPRLGVGSPARNSGRKDFLPNDAFDLDGDSNLSERIAEDLDGDRRIRGGAVDRGAFESTGS